MVVNFQRGIGVVFAVLVAFVCVLGGGLAQAAPDVAGEPEVGNIDPDVPRSLTIHKFAGPSFDDPGVAGDGSEIGDTPDRALSGVEFKIARVSDIDLTDSTQWAQVADLQVGADGSVDGHVLGQWVVKETVDGVAAFADVQMGVYVVMEGADNGGNSITRRAEPFIVTVPFPHEQGWLYDVHAYPKNSVTEISKSVADDAVVGGDGGDLVVWTVDVMVPDESEALESFIVSDTFDDRLAYAADPGAQVVGDFTSDDYTVEVDGQTVDVVLTDSGLAKLDQIKGQVVQVSFPTRVVDPGADGIIPNTATVYVDDPGKTFGHESDTPETYWGKVTVHKFEQGANKVLEGAEFGVFLTEADAQVGENAVVTLVSDGEGMASQILAEGTYYLKETKAPAGFVLADEVHEFTINTKAENGDVVIEAVMDIPNVKSDVPGLPITGAAGRVILTVGGAALLLLAVGTALVTYRRKHN
ncbi:MAG: SpaH/EbpB family LPXTG-anchored major pilin [Flaviflexus sp.]|nr:SpaH/EbpB family LPXTG-anchored major pilin [Flaviflexus sp.]